MKNRFFLDLDAKLVKNRDGINRTTKTAIKFELCLKFGMGV